MAGENWNQGRDLRAFRSIVWTQNFYESCSKLILAVLTKPPGNDLVTREKRVYLLLVRNFGPLDIKIWFDSLCGWGCTRKHRSWAIGLTLTLMFAQLSIVLSTRDAKKRLRNWRSVNSAVSIAKKEVYDISMRFRGSSLSVIAEIAHLACKSVFVIDNEIRPM